jgi:hypothetical protein
MAELAIASAVIGAVSTIAQGSAQASMLKSQALDAEFKGKSQGLAYRQRALQYKQQGIKVLNQIQRTAATINARAGAASLDPFSGSVGALQTTSLREGFFDHTISTESGDFEKDNATLAIKGSERNAANLRKAAKTAKQMSYLKATQQLAGAGYQYSQLGGAPGFAGGAAPNDLGASGSGFGMRDDTWGGYGTPTMDDYSFLSGHQYKHSTRNWTLY